MAQLLIEGALPAVVCLAATIEPRQVDGVTQLIGDWSRPQRVPCR